MAAVCDGKVGLGEPRAAAKTSFEAEVRIVISNCALAVFRMWDEFGAERRKRGIGRFRPIVRDTQTIHKASTPMCSLRLFTGRYGATGAL